MKMCLKSCLPPLTIKVNCNCGSLTTSTKRKLTATPRVAAAVAVEDDKSEKQVSKYHKRGEDSKTDSSDSDAN